MACRAGSETAPMRAGPAYEDPAYTGFFATFTSCGDIAATYVVLAGRPTQGDYLMLVQAQGQRGTGPRGAGPHHVLLHRAGSRLAGHSRGLHRR